MKTLNTKLILSALSLVAMLASPALAQGTKHQTAQQSAATSQAVSHYPDGSTRSGSESNTFEQTHGYYGSAD